MMIISLKKKKNLMELPDAEAVVLICEDYEFVSFWVTTINSNIKKWTMPNTVCSLE